MTTAPRHDDRKGRHYYNGMRNGHETEYSSDDPCGRHAKDDPCGHHAKGDPCGHHAKGHHAEGERVLSLTIVGVDAYDIRFPTSRTLAGSDAMNKAPDYSAAYVILRTDHPAGLEGHGLTFTIGRGNEVCVAAIRALAPLVIGRTLESFTSDMRAFWRLITGDSQLRWIGPEKGVIHLADSCSGQRGLGSVGQGRRQATLEAAHRHDARAACLLHRFPLHYGCPDS